MASGRLLLLTGFLAIANGDPAAGQSKPESPAPIVSDAVNGGDHGKPFAALDKVPAGYLEEERFISGTATSYRKTGTWATDGRWEVAAAGTSPYKVRMLIRRPRDAKRFNGILVVEWLNVSALIEGAADYMQMEEEIVREGYAWVGIGAQNAGVNAPRSGLKAWDPERYGSLAHPGDQYSYDIFSQALLSLKRPLRPVLGALKVRYVIATGRSQSAFRLVTFINAVHPLAPLADGFLVHSRSAAAAGLTADGLGRDADAPIPAGAKLRSDLKVPILDLVTEGDIVNLRAHLTAEPPRPGYRRWEIAGAAHAETPLWIVEVPPPLDHATGCLDPVNSAPHHSVAKAALHALSRWVKNKMPPAQSPAIEIADPAVADPVARDQNGNAKGGIRLPELEVPTATLDGVRNEVAQAPPGTPNFCFLFGHTRPFEAPKLKSLYATHDAFVRQFNAAADRIVRDGYWLKPEADAARRAALTSRIGR
jgi:Alpha/beta hydrolase domain